MLTLYNQQNIQKCDLFRQNSSFCIVNPSNFQAFQTHPVDSERLHLDIILNTIVHKYSFHSPLKPTQFHKNQMNNLSNIQLCSWEFSFL